MTQHGNSAKRTETIVIIALFSALIAVATAFVKLPTPLGYIHIGDAFIFAGAMILGPYAAIPALLGSGFADLIAGYAMYIPATILIKGLMGWIAGFVLHRQKRPFSLNLIFFMRTGLLFSVCECIMAAGYLLFETVFFDFGAALGALPFNLIQGVAGLVIGLVFLPILQKLPIRYLK